MRGASTILYRPRVTEDPRSDEDGGGDAYGGLDAASRHLIEQYGRPFVQGDILFREGEGATHAYLLQQGRVRLLKRVRMVERSLSVLRPGDLFGEGAIIDGAVRMSTAVALSDGIMLSIDRPALRSIVERYPQLAERIVTQLVRRLRDAEDQIEVLMLRDTQSKVVSALLKMAKNQPGPLELTVSPVDLSSRVGLDVETVKRTVQRLRDQQYLRIVGERVEIPDVDALRRLYALLGTKDELRGER
ncbi:MAG: Crp/Fnr family transcriptional regulator [Labilithrix sp.]|nr:Crp/Fnr family transcriptional regulator [Labilithrix sp.]